MEGNGIGVVRVVGLAVQFELRAGAQSTDDVLAPFERDSRNLGMKTLPIG
jgi:hypothetical protein